MPTSSSTSDRREPYLTEARDTSTGREPGVVGETVPRDIVPSRRPVTPGNSETYSGAPGGR